MKAAKFMRDAARWMLLAALFFAPWDYGSTPDDAVVRLTLFVGAAVVIWSVGRLVQAVRQRPQRDVRSDAARGRVSRKWLRVLAALSFLLLAFGWWMAANAKTIYDADFHLFVAVRSIWTALPGSVDQALSVVWMLRVTVSLGAMWMVVELVRDQRWLLRLWNTVGVAGGSIALLGLMQKASGAPMIFWRNHEPPLTTFFATFFYHGNAGAFLNLTLPLTIGLALRAFTRRSQPLARALWLTLSVVSVVAAFANTSRMSQFLAAAMLLVMLGRLAPSALGAARYVQWSTAIAGLLALLFAAYAVIQTSRLDQSWKRWERIGESVPMDNRWVGSQVALRAVPDAGWAGFGPGTFSVVFPYYSGSAGEGFTGFWRFLHEDYLQTLLDWGWFGSTLWAGLFFGGMLLALSHRFQRASAENWSPRQRLLVPLILLALGSVALHGLVDFPLQIASIQFYVAVYLGVCWGSGEWGGEGEGEGGRGKSEVRSQKSEVRSQK